MRRAEPLTVENLPDGDLRTGSLVNTAWVSAPGQDNGIRLVDVDVDTTAYTTVHIAGAANVPWATTVAEGGTFKSVFPIYVITTRAGPSGDR